MMECSVVVSVRITLESERSTMDDLKVDWAEIAQRRMFPHTIVERLDVLKNGGPSLLMGFEVLA